jgi:YbgC/YbaW family acyl-CoA thioester hydrolase
MASDDRQRYRALIDRLVRCCREGQGQIPADRARHGVWNSNAITQLDGMPDQQRMNAVLAAMNEADREVLAQMLYDAFCGGVHETLVVLHEEGVPPFDDGYEETPFHDFSGRLRGWPWPVSARSTPDASTGAVSCSPMRVRPRHCDAQGIMHASRYYEYFEDAFLDWLENFAGGYASLRATGVDLVIAASGCEHRRGPSLGDLIMIETSPLRVGRTSITMQFRIVLDGEILAEGRTTYVAVRGGTPVVLPGTLRAQPTAADR